MNYFFKAFNNYFNFKGRATRREFWMFFLIAAIIGIVLGLIDRFVLGINSSSFFTKGIMEGVFALFIAIPYLSLIVRRLHDTGRSGLWMLVVIIPIAGQIWLVIMLAQKGQIEENKYGEKPNNIVTN